MLIHSKLSEAVLVIALHLCVSLAVILLARQI